jgi:transposase-like protein
MKHKVLCPAAGCRKIRRRKLDPAGGKVVRFGFFFRADDSRRVQRYLCRRCGRHFSAATLSDTYRQKKRRINEAIRIHLVSKTGLNRTAVHVKVNPKTVARRLKFHARKARRYFKRLKVRRLGYVQFDEMQSSIHTKCKPVAIPLAVDVKTRFILAIGVASMPAQHPLTKIALRKYGPRADDRPRAMATVLKRIQPMITRTGQIHTDAAPRYPEAIKEILPGRVHLVSKSRKGCATGQGELKKTGFDPLFSLNHTAAMKRDYCSRLLRRTWCTSKKMTSLLNHLYVCAHFHNTVMLPELPQGA